MHDFDIERDYYAELGVTPSATEHDITKQYRKLARAAHPDRKGGDHERLVRLNDAARVLRDPDVRRRYDDARRLRTAPPHAPHVDEAPPDFAAAQEKLERVWGPRIARANGTGEAVLAAVMGMMDWYLTMRRIPHPDLTWPE